MLAQLHEVLAAGRAVREVEDGIHSVFPAAASATRHHYDRLAAGYDRIIGNPHYQRLTFGNRPNVSRVRPRGARRHAGQALPRRRVPSCVPMPIAVRCARHDASVEHRLDPCRGL